MRFGAQQATLDVGTPTPPIASHACDSGVFEATPDDVPASHPLALAPSRRARTWTIARTLLCSDVVSLALALAVNELLWSPSVDRHSISLPFAVAVITLTVSVAHLLGLYENDHKRADHVTADEIFSLFEAVLITAWLLFATNLLAGAHWGDARDLVVLSLSAPALMFVGRAATRAMTNRRGTSTQRTVILGAGKVGHLLAHKMISNPRLGLELVGFIDEQPLTLGLAHPEIPVLGGLEDLDRLIPALGIERVIIAFSQGRDMEVLQAMPSLDRHSIQIDIVPRLFESVGLHTTLHTLEGLPLLGLGPSSPPARASLQCKRSFDVLAAGLGLVALAPLLALIALAIKLDSRGPVLYRSERIGRGARRLQLRKFRTMTNEACRGERYGGERAEALFAAIMDDPVRNAEFQRTHKLRHDPRVTRLGKLLRRTSLDELPQLVNVIRGDLSLVGPRPVMAYEVEKLQLLASGEREPASDAIARVTPLGYWELDWLRPGVTGYWQVIARSDVGYEERLRLDLIYMTSWSLKLDLAIVARTLGALAGRGAY